MGKSTHNIAESSLQDMFLMVLAVLTLLGLIVFMSLALSGAN